MCFESLLKAPKDIEKSYKFPVGHIARLVRSRLKDDMKMFSVFASILIVPVLLGSRDLGNN